MDLKKFLCVDAEHIRLIDYIFIDQDLNNPRYAYSKPSSIAVGGENSVEIFNKNGIPTEYQKMYMAYKGLNFKRFKAKEFLTDTIVDISIGKSGNIFGQMVGNKPAFDVSNCYQSSREDVLEFITGLRENQILDNYLNALSEIMHIHIKSYFDTNANKIKKR